MSNYLNAFYGATNAFCSEMTSVMYANEIQGVNAVTENNKLLGADGFTVSVKEPWSTTATRYREGWMTISQARATVKSMMSKNSTYKQSVEDYCHLSTSAGVIAAFDMGVQAGDITQNNCSYLHHTFNRATIAEMVNHEGSLVKGGASVHKMSAFAAAVQAANTEFSNVKNQAQTGVSQINGWVQTDGDELTGAVNLLSTVLQGLASPVSVS